MTIRPSSVVLHAESGTSHTATTKGIPVIPDIKPPTLLQSSFLKKLFHSIKETFQESEYLKTSFAWEQVVVI